MQLDDGPVTDSDALVAALERYQVKALNVGDVAQFLALQKQSTGGRPLSVHKVYMASTDNTTGEAMFRDSLPSLVLQVLGEKYGIFFSGLKGIFEVGQTDKAAALDRLITHLGITWSDVVTFGDEENDITMNQRAAWGVAMAHTDCEALKQVKICQNSAEQSN